MLNLTKLDAGKGSTTANPYAVDMFVKYVNKIMTKPENIMKLLEMNNDKFFENMKQGGYDETEIDKMLVLKGIKKEDKMKWLMDKIKQ